MFLDKGQNARGLPIKDSSSLIPDPDNPAEAADFEVRGHLSGQTGAESQLDTDEKRDAFRLGGAICAPIRGACALLRAVGYPLRGTLGASDRFAVILLGEEEVRAAGSEAHQAGGAAMLVCYHVMFLTLW